MNTTVELAVAALEPSRTNPRRTMDKTTLGELAASIRANGLLQPLLVRPIADAKGKYEVVCGNRRLVALRESGIEKCAATIRELTDDEAADAQQVENLQREDVPPLEEGEAFSTLVKKHGIDKVAAKIGKTTAFIRRRMMLTRLTGQARKLLQSGNLPIKSAELIAAVEDEAIRKELCEGLDETGITPGAIAEYLRREVLVKLAAAPFNKLKVYGCPHEDGRVCADCPFNTGAEKGQLFPELAKDARCLNGKCFRAKADADFKLKAEAHAAKGGGVLGEKDAKRCWPYGHGSYFDDAAFVPLEAIRPVVKVAKYNLATKDVLIVQNPRTFEVRWVVPRSVAVEIWNKAKALTNGASHERGSDNPQRDERRRQRIEGEKRKSMRIAYTKALGAVTSIDAKFHPSLAAALAGKLNHDQWRVICAARAVEKPKGMTWEQERRFEKKLVSDLTKSQLAGFVLQCLVLIVDSFNVDTSTRTIASAAGINGKKIEEAVADAIRERFTARKPQSKADWASARSRRSEVSKVSVAAKAA